MLGATGLCVIATAVFLISNVASQKISIYVAGDSHAGAAAATDTIAVPVDMAVEFVEPVAPAVAAAPVEPAAPAVSPTAKGSPDLTVTKPTPEAAVNAVSFSEKRPDYRFKIIGFKGYGVRESSSVSHPVLIADDEWARAVKMETSVGTLWVTVDIKRLTDSYGAHFRARNYCPVTIVVPKGWLRGASVGTRTLYLDSISADRFIAVSADRITLTGCRIGLLECAGRRLNELKLDNTAVREADIRAVSPTFRLTGTSRASEVGQMEIRSVSIGKTVHIDIHGLSIGELRWNSGDLDTKVSVTSKDPVNFKRR